MAEIHNGIKYATPDLNALAIVSGVDRSKAGVERLGETLTPGIDIYAYDRPDWAIHRGEILWATTVTVPAVVGEFGYAAVSLPFASNAIVILEDISMQSSVALFAFLEVNVSRAAIAATLTQGTFPMSRDQRAGIPTAFNRAPPVEIWTGSDASAVLGIATEELASVAGAYTPFRSTPYIVKPGGGIVVEGNLVNTQLTVNLKGRYRACPVGELNPVV